MKRMIVILATISLVMGSSLINPQPVTAHWEM